MKNSMWKHIYAFLILLELSIQGFSQKKSEIAFGLAFPEMSNIKIKYGTGFQIGAGLGFMPVINFFTITGDMYYNFPKKLSNTNPNSWNINLGGTFINIIHNDRVIVYYSRLGRKIYFKNNSGINLDLGLGYLKSYEAMSRPIGRRGGQNYPSSVSLSPVGSISYFKRF